jgi:hypothetical protein
MSARHRYIVREASGYVRCGLLMPMLGCKVLPVPETPMKRVLELLTDDGQLAIEIDAEAAQVLSELLAKAIIEMREESERQSVQTSSSVNTD